MNLRGLECTRQLQLLGYPLNASLASAIMPRLLRLFIGNQLPSASPAHFTRDDVCECRRPRSDIIVSICFKQGIVHDITIRDATLAPAIGVGIRYSAVQQECRQGYPANAIHVQKSSSSRPSANHDAYRISLRSSSPTEPKHYLLKVGMQPC